MSQQPPQAGPGITGSSPLEEAYRSGYLAGHLAGWGDALKAQSQLVSSQALQQSPPQAPAQAPPQAPVQPSTTTPPPQTPAHAPAHAPVQALPQAPVPAAAPVSPAAVQTRPSAPVFPPVTQQRVMHPTPESAGVHDPAALAAKKSKRETQNINIALYVASLLMVAAAALFVGSSLPVTARLIGVWLGAAVFYAAGLLLHNKVARLKPAAIAFTGTALAIIPFAGLATYNLGFPNAPAVWLFTSLVGTVAYVLAAVQMQSRLIVYLSLAFLLSTAWSSTAILGAALAWCFAALIVFSALLSLLGNLLTKTGKNSRLAGLYAKPLSDLGPWFAPVGLIASLVAASALNAADHLLVLVAGSIYYAVMLFVPSPVPRRWNYVGLRASLTLAAPFVGWLLQPESVWAAAAFTMVLLVQIIPLAYGQKQLDAFLDRAGWVKFDVLISVPLLALAGFSWSVLILQGREFDSDALLVWGLAAGLLAAILVVPAMLPAGEWLPAPAILMGALMSLYLGALDWTILLSMALAYALFRYTTTKSALIKDIALVAARILATALVAAVLAALIPAQPGKSALIVAAIAVIAGLQLLLDAVFVKRGVSNLVTKYSAAAWTLIGLCLVVMLSELASHATAALSAGSSAGLGLVAATPWEFLVAAGVLGISTAIYSLSCLTREKDWVSGEILAPVYLIIAAIVTGPVFNAGGASIAWTLVMGYFLIGGAQLKAKTAHLHRWSYWRTARAVSLLLAVALFQLWLEFDPSTSLGDSHVSLGQVLLLALVPQLIILIVVARKNRKIPGLDADIVITLGAAILSAGLQQQPTDLLPVLLAGVIAALTIARLMVVTAMLGDTFRMTFWGAPIALVAVALWNTEHYSHVTIVLITLVAASALIAARAQTLILRSSHFLLASIALTALGGVLADWIFDSPAVVTLVLCAVLLAQIPVQIVVIRSEKMTHRVGHPVLRMISGWLFLAALLALPASYYAVSGGFEPGGEGLRWIVLLELVALALAAIIGQTQLFLRGASYLALLAIIGGASVIAPMMWSGALALILLALMVAVSAWAWIRPPATVEMRWYWLVATAAFLMTASVVDGDADPGIFASMWLVAGLALILGAHRMAQAALTLPGTLLVFVAAVLVRFQTLELTARPGVSALTGFLVVMGVLYLVRLLLMFATARSAILRSVLVSVALAGGLIFAIWSMVDLDTILYGAGAFTIVAGLSCLEAPARTRWMLADIAVLASALVWFIACSVHIYLGSFWGVLWCAMAVGTMALIRYLRQLPIAGKNMLMVASGFASFAAVLTIFSGETVQQLVILLVFVALIAVGLSLDERVFTIWGAVGVATAVLWYLRGFTYLMLAILALALIGFAIWRLNRKRPSSMPNAIQSTTPAPPAPPIGGYGQAHPGNGPHPGADTATGTNNGDIPHRDGLG